MSPPDFSHPPALPRTRKGFTLIEVALAVALITVVFVALLGLLPGGASTFRRALDLSVCAQIAQRVVSDAQEADFDVFIDERNLPDGQEGRDFTFRAPQVQEARTRYFDEQGSEIVPRQPPDLSPEERHRVVYQVNVRIMPRAPLPTGREGAAPVAGSSRGGHLAQVTVQVAHSSGREPELSGAEADDPGQPQRNLWLARQGMELFTYSAMIGRNQ